MNLLSLVTEFFQKHQDSISYSLFTLIVAWIGTHLWDFVRRFAYNSQFKGLCGRFAVYAFAENGSGALSEFEYEIRFRFGKLVVTGGSSNCRYKGYATATESILYLRLDGVNHVEQIQTVWAKPPHANVEILYGAGSAINGGSQPIAYRAILSRKKLAKDEAIKMLREMPFTESEGLVRIERDQAIGERNAFTVEERRAVAN